MTDKVLRISVDQPWAFHLGFFNALFLLLALPAACILLPELMCICGPPSYFATGWQLVLILGSWLFISRIQFFRLLDGLPNHLAFYGPQKYLWRRTMIQSLPSACLLISLVAIPAYAAYYLFASLASILLLMLYDTSSPYSLKLIKGTTSSSADRLVPLLLVLLLLPRAAQACSCSEIERYTREHMRQLQTLVQSYAHYQGHYPDNLSLLEQDAKQRGYWIKPQYKPGQSKNYYTQALFVMADQAHLIHSLEGPSLRIDLWPGKTTLSVLYRRTASGYEITGTDRYGHLLGTKLTESGT